MDEETEQPLQPVLEGEVEDEDGHHWSVKLWNTASLLVKPSDLEYAVPFILTMVGCHFFFWSTSSLVDVNTLTWWEERHPLMPLTAEHCIPEIKEPLCLRFIDQWTVAVSRAEHHFWIMRFYTIRYFGFLATAFACATAATASLVVITKSGWDYADHRLKGIFLGLVCGAGFFGGFPTLTLHSQNIADNTAAYNGYDDLATEIRTYVATQQAVNGDHSDPREFAHHVDLKLMSLNAVHVSFDENAINLGSQKLLEAAGEIEPEDDHVHDPDPAEDEPEVGEVPE